MVVYPHKYQLQTSSVPSDQNLLGPLLAEVDQYLIRPFFADLTVHFMMQPINVIIVRPSLSQADLRVKAKSLG